MRVITAGTGRVAITEAVDTILREGQDVRPRGLKTLELSPATFVIHDPADVLPTGINRAKLHPPIGAAEALQGIAGVSTPELLVRIAPNFKMFLNDSGAFDGAYGPRLLPQLEAAYQRLKSDEDTRQAIATIWNEGDALREGSKDYPCTILLHFLIRNHALNLSVYMRSNDIWWGTPYDFFQFTQIQHTMANCLGLAVGTYYHTATSLHLYERDFEAAKQLCAEERGTFDVHRVTGIGAQFQRWDHVRERAMSLLRGALPRDYTEQELWYQQQLAPYADGTLR